MSHFSDKFATTCRDFMGLAFSHGVRLVGRQGKVVNLENHPEEVKGPNPRLTYSKE
jgi:hypothetical protein